MVSNVRVVVLVDSDEGLIEVADERSVVLVRSTLALFDAAMVVLTVSTLSNVGVTVPTLCDVELTLSTLSDVELTESTLCDVELTESTLCDAPATYMSASEILS